MVGSEGRRKTFLFRRRHVNRAQDRSPLNVNLGIDFGTSYTKVCYRNVGTDKSGILTFEGGAYLPSIVLIGENGTLSTPLANNGRSSTEVAFLKMKIGEYSNSQDSMFVQALSSYYLADIIRGAMDRFRLQEAELSDRQQIRWSANIGVPVDHYDSPKLVIFREVFAIAWMWAVSNGVPTTVQGAIEQYRTRQREVDLTATDCHAVPEIVAAVWSFVKSRSARPGIYTYFDIGGGTLDGVCFGYENSKGARLIRCYSGKVAPLGVSLLTHGLRRPGGGNVERVLAADTLPSTYIRNHVAKYENQIKTLVAEIIMTAKCKIWGGFRGIYLEDSVDLLPIFLGGGGSRSAWYRLVIKSTYGSRQLDRAGIPLFDLKEVPKPPDLEMKNLSDDKVFSRFTISYGLSVPAGEMPNFFLPSGAYPFTRRRKRNDVAPFEIQKDLYE